MVNPTRVMAYVVRRPSWQSGGWKEGPRAGHHRSALQAGGPKAPRPLERKRVTPLGQRLGSKWDCGQSEHAPARVQVRQPREGWLETLPAPPPRSVPCREPRAANTRGSCRKGPKPRRGAADGSPAGRGLKLRSAGVWGGHRPQPVSRKWAGPGAETTSSDARPGARRPEEEARPGATSGPGVARAWPARSPRPGQRARGPFRVPVHQSDDPSSSRARPCQVRSRAGCGSWAGSPGPVRVPRPPRAGWSLGWRGWRSLGRRDAPRVGPELQMSRSPPSAEFPCLRLMGTWGGRVG